jgi:biopolymer transport protein TolR
MAFGIHRYSRRGSNRRAPMAEINVTPLVDVMLVLLVIFMVTAPLLKAGVPVDLPDSRAKALAETPDQVTLSISAVGQVFIDDQPVAPGQLGEAIGQLKPGADGKMPLVTLRADKALDYGRVIAVMGELNRAGITAISLVTGISSTQPSLIGGSPGGQ